MLFPIVRKAEDMGKKFRTSTKLKDGTLSPWLAASGPLSYTPENPPNSKYFFQYSWLMPSLFKDKKHYYFGYPFASFSRWDNYTDRTIDFLISFWEHAKTDSSSPIVILNGKITARGFNAPIACYSYRERNKHVDSYIFIQHGSYLTVPTQKQPHVHEGKVLLYRGIGNREIFDFFTPNLTDVSPEVLDSLRRYWLAHEHSFSDSETSFSVSHSRVNRCETGHLRTESDWTTISMSVGLDLVKCSFARKMSNFHLQSFTFDENIAKQKFGPNYVVCLSPIENIRLTTFFADEQEVFVINPTKLEIIASFGCKIKNFC